MPKIKIYTTATCAYCRAEKAWLKAHDLDYEEIHADQDPKAAEELLSLSGQLGVPFTVVTTDEGASEKVLGFDQARLTSVLGLS
jgi:glutaredoxin 3